MSIRSEAVNYTTEDYVTQYIYDNPKQCAFFSLNSDFISIGDGFSLYGAGAIVLPPLRVIYWYRYTDRGMLFGYIGNGGSTSVTLPNSVPIYYTIRSINLNLYQPKVYLSCIDFDLYHSNHFSLYHDYLTSSDEESFARIAILKQLECIQLKGFKENTVASYVLLPYTQFNTSKFDFHHTAYNEDGSLKDYAYFHSTMLADGGSLKPLYYPQPTRV